MEPFSSLLENAVFDIGVAFPTRRRILELLRAGDMTAGELAEHFDITMIDTRYYKRPVIKLAEDEGFSRVLVLCNLDTLSSAKPFEILRMGLK